MENQILENNIGIIGAGNIGTELAGELAYRQFNVYLYTSKVNLVSSEIEVNDEDIALVYSARIRAVTDDLKLVCDNCRTLIVTYPSNVFRVFAKELEKYIKKGTRIIVLPGTGGCEYTFKNCIDQGNTLIGLQRVPGVYRLKEYGKRACISGRKKVPLVASSIPSLPKDELEKFVSHIFNMKVTAISNYLNITLTPSNPLLHTSRLYSMFKDYEPNHVFNRNPLFYYEWDDESSRRLIECDNELKEIKKKLEPIDLTSVTSLLEYYESHDATSLTNKIKSIPAFKNIGSPMVEENSKFKIDWASRYFTSDFPQGIVILKAIALILSVKTPMMDKIIKWYQTSSKKAYFKEDMISFDKDINECNIPQNYGIDTIQKLREFYK